MSASKVIWERAAFSLLTADESWQPAALGTAWQISEDSAFEETTNML